MQENGRAGENRSCKKTGGQVKNVGCKMKRIGEKAEAVCRGGYG